MVMPKKSATEASVRQKILKIAYQALGHVDVQSKTALMRMEVKTLATCTGLMLKAKSQALNELRESFRKPTPKRKEARHGTK